MSTYTASTMGYNTSSLANWITSNKYLQLALLNLGWVQTNDTGQVQWEAVIKVITATALTSNVAYYYVADTSNLRVGQSITVTGLTNNSSTYNATSMITSISTNTYFTLAITASNIAYTSDSGTAAVSAISAVPSSSSYVYEIFRMGDSLQSSMPVYLKFYWGQSATPNARCDRVSIGSGTNGSGTLTNEVFISQSSNTPSTCTSTSTTLYNCYFSGDSSRLSMVYWADSPTGINAQVLIVERSKNSTGNDTADFAQVYHAQTLQSTSSIRFATVLYKGSASYSDNMTIAANANGVALATISFANSQTLKDNNISVLPFFCCYGGVSYPFMGIAHGKNTDWVAGETVSISIYPNVPHTYLIIKNSDTYSAVPRVGQGTNNTILLRWD